MKQIILFHRGDVSKYNENTIDSIVSIQSNNLIKNKNYLFGVEFDIQINKDNSLVCYHDDNIKGLKNKVESSDDNFIFDNNINFLEDILEKITSKEIILNVELKIYNLSIDRIHFFCNKLKLILKKYDLNFLLTSFNKDAIRYLMKNKTYKLGMIFCERIDKECIPIIPELDYIVIDKKQTSIINKYKDKKILFYTLKDSDYDIEIVKKFKLNENVGFISDDVYELIKYLDN